MSQDALETLKIDRSAPARKRGPSRKPWFVGALVVALVAAGFALSSRQALEVETARVAQAWPSQGITALNATGYVVADTKASVASKTTGRLEWLGVREGSPVRAGEVIARMENADIRAQLAQREADVESARARVKQGEAEQMDADFNLKRQQDLKAQGFVAQAAVDAAQNRAQQARATIAAQQAAVRASLAAVAEIRVTLDNSVIRAPFAGVVLTKQADVGDVVTPLSASSNSKAAVVTMADLSTLEIEADVSETNLARARVDQPVEIQLDALPELRLLGRVSRIVPTVDRSKATVKFKIRFDEKDARVLPDMSARVAFLERPLRPDERTPRLAVNPAAVVEGKVFVFRDGIARTLPVSTGDRLGDLIEVKSGLQAGDIVILNPSARLQDGGKVVEKKS
ncbi:efflux RND transporter periplasmic adaptor subunit [Uliginosibacterium sp. 31-16]|uniref:efflux RND transporter periplasmic adaptor subunit n=1 Tax=Uliginosibacterium sp. 31-16 TaxID=3068315 RepID=UPI00273D2CD3|nr:efflux RND transporter periplasmic adaptor subunit [Uliginosibacterium sp. 31-16]MDP5240219.1 efflux RND transporter periplasmic adaptor subunit [Uliginosibacterium sp. 31-16]